MKFITNTSVASRPRLRRVDVTAYLAANYGIDIAVSTLAKMATVGGGPPVHHNGRIPTSCRSVNLPTPGTREVGATRLGCGEGGE